MAVRRLLYALVALNAVSGSVSARPSSVQASYHRIGGARVYVVTVNLGDPQVKVAPAVSRWGNGTTETYRSMIRRIQPTAAITGTFFCSRTHIPTGDIVTDGRLVHYGGVGTALAITSNNEAMFIPRKKYRRVDWTGFETVLCAGPRLLWDGRTVVNPRAEGFRDRHMINARTNRLGVGVTRDNKLKLVAAKGRLHLRDLARIMKRLGCIDAIDLDQGSSSALFFRGRTYIKPSRSLTNMLMVFDSRNRYEHALRRLVPDRWLARSPRLETAAAVPRAEPGM